MNTKKPRIIVMVLGLICIIMAASTITAFALAGTSTDELKEKEKTIADLNTQLAKLTNELAILMQNQNQYENQTSQINDLKTQIDALNSDLDTANKNLEVLKKIVNLDAKTVIYNKTLIQNAGDRNNIFHESTAYAGYILIEATSNSTNSCYFEISYTFKNVLFEHKVYLDKANEKTTIILPVLPATLKIILGNDNDNITTEDAKNPTIYDNKVQAAITLVY
ncbi:MAG: hypothetical protein LBH79_08585 [Nitrososphaerota archaeon]|jgi:predicted RNase H-like nuclease (RuvC/YqgF family)|nr:hypothetical protein [Nitrososphaerota archaeon]